MKKGLERESSYPYKGRDGSCYFHSSYAVAHMSNYGRVRRGDEDQLKRVVANMVLTLDSSRVLQFNISTKQFRDPPVSESGPATTGCTTTARESSPASVVTAGR